MLFWPVEGGQAFGIADIVLVAAGIVEVDMKWGRNRGLAAVGNMDSGLVELVDSHIDLVVEEEVCVVEEDI